jgi:hypothetical protein
MPNQGFCRAACQKFVQGHGWMRPGATKRPCRPLDTRRSGFPGGTQSAIAAQRLLIYYAAIRAAGSRAERL